MGSQPCFEVQREGPKKSAAYGDYEILIEKDREYAVVHKTIERHVSDV